jgi:hypothetical protein
MSMSVSSLIPFASLSSERYPMRRMRSACNLAVTHVKALGYIHLISAALREECSPGSKTHLLSSVSEAVENGHGLG